MFRKKKMRYREINVWVACLCLLLAACDKDENNNSNNFAIGIVELPALRNGANDVFVTHYTTFNGQKVTSFSMEYDKSKKHSRWVAFRFDNQTRMARIEQTLKNMGIPVFAKFDHGKNAQDVMATEYGLDKESVIGKMQKLLEKIVIQSASVY